MKKIIGFLLAVCLLFVSCQSSGGTHESEIAVEHSVESINLLIAEGGNLEAKNSYGETALIFTAKNENIEVLKSLIEAGSDLDAQNNDGKTALDVASFEGHTETIKVLTEAVADIESRGEVTLIHKEYIFENKSSDTVILFIHGILGTPNQFLDFIDALQGRFSILNLLLPGHGKSGSDFTNSSMQEWSDYVTSVVLNLQSQSKYEHIIIVSHSMGGLLAIETVNANPQKIRGMFMVGLPLHIKLSFAGVVVGYKMIFNRIEETDAPIMAAKKAYSIDNKSLLCYVSWLPHFWELFKKGQQVRPLVKDIAIPAVCVQSGNDEFVSQRSNRYIEDNPYITLHTLPESRHFYYEKSEQEDMLALFLQFLDELNC